MAIDSRQKRQSSYKTLIPFFERSVHPTGTIGVEQRVTAGLIYSGLVESVIPSIPQVILLMPDGEVAVFVSGIIYQKM